GNRVSTTHKSSPLRAGSNVPAGTLAMVRSSDALRTPMGGNALSTLIRQRHPNPSCGGSHPTAERTMDPASIVAESLTPRPGIREQYRSDPEERGGSRARSVESGQLTSSRCCRWVWDVPDPDDACIFAER